MPNEAKTIVKAVLKRYPRSFAEEVGVRLGSNTPSNLYQLLCFAILASTRISHDNASRAARALFKQGWTTALKMSRITWEIRVRVLNRHGYARYDESTSRMLGENCQLLLERYGGDLRRLRQQAQRDVKHERELLKQFKGIGDTGADIFFREVQAAWDELYPFADRRAAAAARQLGLPRKVDELVRLVRSRPAFVRLTSGIVRARLENVIAEIKSAAGT